MVASAVLAGLLRQLSRAASPLERMKLLAMSWRALRQMSPQERESLARAVGLDEAHDLVEQIADPKVGLSPSKLLVALQQTDEADVSKLGSLLASLKSSKGRKDLLQKSVQKLSNRLDPPAPKPTPKETAAPAQPNPKLVVTPPQVLPQSELERSVPTATKPQVTTQQAPKRKAAVATAAVVAATAAPAVKPAAKAQKTAPQPAPHSVPRKSPGKKIPTATPVTSDSPTPASPKPRLGETGKGLLVKVRACDGINGKFRLLRQRGDLMKRLTWPQMRELAESFPDGWARRRAVDLVLAACTLKSLSGIADMLSLLANENDQNWVLAGLIRNRNLSNQEKSHLGEMDLPPRLRRLLERQNGKRSA